MMLNESSFIYHLLISILNSSESTHFNSIHHKCSIIIIISFAHVVARSRSTVTTTMPRVKEEAASCRAPDYSYQFFINFFLLSSFQKLLTFNHANKEKNRKRSKVFHIQTIILQEKIYFKIKKLAWFIN